MKTVRLMFQRAYDTVLWLLPDLLTDQLLQTSCSSWSTCKSTSAKLPTTLEHALCALSTEGSLEHHDSDAKTSSSRELNQVFFTFFLKWNIFILMCLAEHLTIYLMCILLHIFYSFAWKKTKNTMSCASSGLTKSRFKSLSSCSSTGLQCRNFSSL